MRIEKRRVKHFESSSLPEKKFSSVVLRADRDRLRLHFPTDKSQSCELHPMFVPRVDCHCTKSSKVQMELIFSICCRSLTSLCIARECRNGECTNMETNGRIKVLSQRAIVAARGKSNQNEKAEINSSLIYLNTAWTANFFHDAKRWQFPRCNQINSRLVCIYCKINFNAKWRNEKLVWWRNLCRCSLPGRSFKLAFVVAEIY